jgi:hypothetical protein
MSIRWKKLEMLPFRWEFFRVTTLTVDDRQMVKLPKTEPGQTFKYVSGSNGTISLVPLTKKTSAKKPVAVVKTSRKLAISSKAPVATTNPEPEYIVAKLVKHGDEMYFELPKGYKLDPEDIGKAVAEERESRG